MSTIFAELDQHPSELERDCHEKTKATKQAVSRGSGSRQNLSAAEVNRECYNRWSQIYDGSVNSTVATDELYFPPFWASHVSRKRVLELGCGTGRHTLRLAQQDNDVTAIDLSPGMLNIARKKLSGFSKVAFIEGDFMNDQSLEMSEEYDVCLAALVLEHIEHLDAFFRLVFKVLKPGGLFFLSEIHPDRIAGGTQAFFVDPLCGETVRLCSYVHAAMDIESHALAEGLKMQQQSDVIGGDDLVRLHADWQRHLGRPMIRMWKFAKEAVTASISVSVAVPAPIDYWSAAREGDVTKLTELMKENAANTSSTAECVNFPHPRDGTRPLSIASANGHIEIVKILLNHSLIDVNAADKYGRTALMMAGSAEIAQRLVDSPSVDLSIRDCEGQTALDKALYYKRNQIVEILRNAEKKENVK